MTLYTTMEAIMDADDRQRAQQWRDGGMRDEFGLG